MSKREQSQNLTEDTLNVTLKFGSIFSVSSAIVLLIVRALFPAIATSIPGVYDFLDETVLPIINWPFGVLQNIIEWICNLPIINPIIQWFANLAA